MEISPGYSGHYNGNNLYKNIDFLFNILYKNYRFYFRNRLQNPARGSICFLFSVFAGHLRTKLRLGLGSFLKNKN